MQIWKPLTLCLALLLACGTGQTSATSLAPVDKKEARETIRLINLERTKRGLKPLKISGALQSAAKNHARDVERRGYGDAGFRNVHVGRNGSKVNDRIKRYGLKPCIALENAAHNWPSPQRVVNAWMKSPGHRKNILYPKITLVGLARAGDSWIMVGAKPCKKR